jgi:hypothetical protein
MNFQTAENRFQSATNISKSYISAETLLKPHKHSWFWENISLGGEKLKIFLRNLRFEITTTLVPPSGPDLLLEAAGWGQQWVKKLLSCMAMQFELLCTHFTNFYAAFSIFPKFVDWSFYKTPGDCIYWSMYPLILQYLNNNFFFF